MLPPGKKFAEEVRARPDWSLPEKSSRLWIEDDADVGCPGHEGFRMAMRRLLGVEDVSRLIVDEWGAEDALYKLMSTGHVVVSSYSGNSEIRRVAAVWMPVSCKLSDRGLRADRARLAMEASERTKS